MATQQTFHLWEPRLAASSIVRTLTIFRDRLREDIGETEISMILGEVDASAAAILVTRAFAFGAITRVTTVGHLRAAGFRVLHSPTKSNRLHVSVYPPFTEGGEPAEWDAELASCFRACFTKDGG